MSARKKTSSKTSAQIAFARFTFIVALFAIWIGVIGVRLVHLQVHQAEWLREKAQDQRRDESKTKSLRGSILDRDQRVLALSVNAKSLFADPSEIEDTDAAARAVARVLKTKVVDLQKELREAKSTGKKFVWLARKVDEDTAQKLNESLKDETIRKYDEPRFQGLHWREEQKRTYPYGSMAAQVVGFSNSEDAGQAGIELAQEKYLKGEVIKKWQDRDRLGRVYEEAETEQHAPPKDVVLTISGAIQYKVEQALKTGVENARAKSGVAIVLDPKTGEVLAMANYPTFDPNKFGEASPETITNRAMQNQYSPGSVFKLVTYSSAIQENLVTADSTVECGPGYIEVAKHKFDDHHCVTGMNLAHALAVSSNLAAIKTGLQVGKQKFYDYATAFGFGRPTGIELPAESRGQFRSPETWNGDTLASMSIGYEMGVTALQTASAFATIANDGVRVHPHIIKEIRDGDGKAFLTTDAAHDQVVSTDTSRQLRRMLREVVLKGTGKRAQLDGYTTAGKTGTAWKYDAKLKKINENKYVSSFIGMAPADNPSIVIAVVLDEPTVGARDGGQVSAPIFHDIAQMVLPEFNIAPDTDIKQDIAQDIPAEIDEKPASNTTDKVGNSKNADARKQKVSDKAATKDSVAKKKSAAEKPASARKDSAKPKSKSTAANIIEMISPSSVQTACEPYTFREQHQI
jgi:cell division protein FtsI (penicillin-binding protein 3)